MRHFDHVEAADRDRLFHRQPEPFSHEDDADFLGVALGATLYTPASRPTLARDIAKAADRGVTSVILCLEDAISDHDVPFAEGNVVAHLGEHPGTSQGEHGPTGHPLVFVRVRCPEQIHRIAEGLGCNAGVISGFVLPKFTEDSGPAFLEAAEEAGRRAGVRYWAMPVIESCEMAFRETRMDALLGVRRVLEKHRPAILAVRIGATDLCAAFGLRRSRDLPIYDVQVVADVIGDVVNVLGRADGTGFVITGPVWEYFSGDEPMFKPLLRETPFVEHKVRGLRSDLVEAHLDGLIREVVLDRTNGLMGKSVIHPTHVAAVHALSVVTHEEYVDATDLLAHSAVHGGVCASRYRNKMNEGKPHRAWAEKILLRARAFGVAREEITFVDLLAAFIPS